MEFAVTSPKLGIGEMVPKIMLSDAFLHHESRFIRRHQGVYKKVRGRLPAFEDDAGVQIACPQYAWAVTNVDVGQKTFTIAGNYATLVAAPVRINGSTGNDGLYTLVSASDVGATTEIVVAETPASAVADGNVFAGSTPVLRYHLHVKESSQSEYLLAATAYHILLWSNTAKTLTVKFTCTDPEEVTYWSMASFQDQVWATNGVDFVQVWDVHTSAGNNFADAEGATGITVATDVLLSAAKYLYAYQGYLFLGYTCEDGTWLPRRIRWCDADDPTMWNVDEGGDQGYKDLTDIEGFVNGFSEWSIYLIIGCTKRIMRGWLTTDDSVFRWERELIEVGCAAPDSMVRDRLGRLFFLASDLTIRELQSADPIYKPIEETIRGINPNAVAGVRGTFFDAMDRILWAIPSVDSATNDLVLEYDSVEGDFYLHQVPVSAFGTYSRQYDITWDTLPYASWDVWDWPKWDANLGQVGAVVFLVSDYSGYAYEWEQAVTDDGTAMTGRLVFGTSLGGRLHEYKRIGPTVLFCFRREPAGSVTISAKRDTELAWTSLGTVDLTNSDNAESVWVTVPIDMRARHYTFQLEATGYFEFYGCYFPNFQTDGVR